MTGALLGSVRFGPWDWAFLLWFLAVTLGVGLHYARRGARNLSEYFVSGRDLPWWMLGTSMVATTFAADTPIAVAAFVVTLGIAKNWLWWSFVAGGTLTVFVFSRWWRRAGLTTEVELIAARYEGRAARGLRAFKAVYLGLILNSLIIGWVTRAMAGILVEVFDVPPVVSIGVLMACTLGYATLSGLWGVVAADVLQFAMAMVGAIVLAVLCVHEVGGLGALVERVRVLETEHGREILALFPRDWSSGFATAVLILALVNWWAVYYPGAEPGGGGYVAQRMLAARDERHARAGTLWFILAHYVLRPWPWILVGLCAIALEPGFLDWQAMSATERAARPELHHDRAYGTMFRYLPVGMLGLVVASFLAAFMSTITTQLNLAASYLVNDLYLPFLARDEGDDRQRVRVARVTVALVTAAGCLVAWLLSSVGEGWMAMMHITAGTGLVLIARWLWWRVNAWSEISAMAASAVSFVFLWLTAPGVQLVTAIAGDADSELASSCRLLLAVTFSTIVWIGTTLCTRPVDPVHLESFYRTVRPGGWWGPVARTAGLPRFAVGRDLAMWLAATVLVFGALLGSGSALLGDGALAAVCLAAALLGGLALLALFRRERAAAPAGGDGRSP